MLLLCMKDIWDMIQELCHQRWERLCKKLTRDVPAHADIINPMLLDLNHWHRLLLMTLPPESVTIQADKLLDFHLQEHLNQLSDIQRNRGLQRLAGGEIWEHWGGKQLTWHHHTEDTKVLSLAMIQGRKWKKKTWSYLHLFSNGIKDGDDAGQATADCNADYKCQGNAEDHKEDIKCQKHDAKPADPVCNSWWNMIEEHLSAI